MDEQTLRSEIRNLISRNQTEGAFELLSSFQFSNVDKQLIILNSQYNRIREDLRLNVISNDEGERRINQINIALLDISSKVKSSKKSATEFKSIPPQKQSFNPKLLLLLLIPVGAFLFYWGMSGDENPLPKQKSEVISSVPEVPIDPKPETVADPKPEKPVAPVPIQKLSWKPKGSSGAVVGGKEAGKNLTVCRCDYKGAKHPGKVVVGLCHIGYGGKEVTVKQFEVLTNSGSAMEKWTPVLNNQLPAGAIIAGTENKKSLYVGRAKRNGIYHPGKVFLAGKKYICNFGYGGEEITEKVNFEVLVSEE